MGSWVRLATGFHPGPLRTVQRCVRKTASFPCASPKSTFPNIKTTVPKMKQTRRKKKSIARGKWFSITLKQTLKMEMESGLHVLLHPPRRLCDSRQLSVCQQNNLKNYEQILMKTSGSGTRNGQRIRWLNFGVSGGHWPSIFQGSKARIKCKGALIIKKPTMLRNLVFLMHI